MTRWARDACTSRSAWPMQAVRSQVGEGVATMIPGTWRSRTCDGRNEMHPSVTLAASRWAWPPQPIRNTHSSIDNATVGRGLSNRRRRDAHADGESQRSECVTMGQGNGSVGRRTGPDQCRPEPRTQGGDSDRRWDKCRQPDLGPRAFAVQICPGIQFVVARTFKGTLTAWRVDARSSSVLLSHPAIVSIKTSANKPSLTVTIQILDDVEEHYFPRKPR